MRSTDRVYKYNPRFEKTVLSNGVRVVTESHPHSRGVSVGFFVELGSRDERDGLHGATHFIEHLVFKGTKKRSAFEIGKSLEAVGGDLNAYTTREYTCFYAETLEEHFPLALDVLTDLIHGARFAAKDFERERQVILQEIDMSKDDLEEYAFDLFMEQVYRGHALGNPIAGTPETVQAISRTNLLKFYKSHYRGDRLIVSAAGPIEHADVVERVQKVLSRLPSRGPKITHTKARYRKFQMALERPSEQAHLLLGLPSSSYKDPRRFESYIVNALLGGGTTSRLYQRVREKKGLVYSIYSYLQAFIDSGLLITYAGTAPRHADQVLDLMREEILKVAAKPPSKREINMYKTQVKGQILLGADDMENRMNSLGVNEMVFGHYRPVECVIDEIDTVNEASVAGYLSRFVRPERFSLLAMGDLSQSRLKV